MTRVLLDVLAVVAFLLVGLPLLALCGWGLIEYLDWVARKFDAFARSRRTR